MADFLKEYLNNAQSGLRTDGNKLSVPSYATRKISALITAYLAQGSRVLLTAEDTTLSEVYSCLPDAVKSRTQYKDEAKSAKPAKVKTLSEKEREECRRALRDKINALKELKNYSETVYGNDVAGGSYYDALDYILSSDLPVLAFAEPEKIIDISPKKFNEILEKVKIASAHYGKMSDGGDISLCPWFGVKNEIKRDEMLAKYAVIKRAMQNVAGGIGSAPDNLTLVNVIAALADNVLEKEEMDSLLCLESSPCDFRSLEELINAYNAVFFAENEKFDMTGSEDVPAFEKLVACGVDESLTYSDLKKICGNSDIFVRGGKYADSLPFDRFLEFAQKISELKAAQKEYRRDALAVFDKLESDEDGETVLKAYEKLRPYLTGARTKPRVFDFAAKASYKKLCAFSSGSLSFENALNAACSYSAASACEDEIANHKQHICRIFGRELADPEFDSLNIVLDRYSKNNLVGLSLSGYLIEAQRAGTLLKRCLQDRACPQNFTVGDFIKAYKLHLRKNALKKAVDGISEAAGIGYKGRELQTLACSLALVMRTATLFGDKRAVTDFLENVRGRDKSFMDDLMLIVNELIMFGRVYFQGYYTRNPFALTVGDLKRFISCADDGELLDAALGYASVKKTKLLPLDKFFEYFEKGAIAAKAEDMPEIFKKSYYKLAVENKLAALGKRRKGLGRHAAVAMEKYIQAESKLSEALAVSACGDCVMLTPEEAAEEGFDILIKAVPPALYGGNGGENLVNSVAGFLAAHGIDGKRLAKNYTTDGVNVPLAVLSGDLTRPVLYVLCERSSRDTAELIEKGARGEALKTSGVAQHRIFIHDWTDNGKSEQASLIKALESIN